MKKIVLLTLMALGIPLVLGAQNANNDLYYVPSSKKEVKTQEKSEVLIKDKNSVPSSIIVKSSAPVSSEAPVTDEEEYRTDNVTSVAPIDDVDAYNRRSSTYGNAEDCQSRSVATTTTTRQKKQVYDDDLEGEWVNGFNGSVSDYEYATRIIRFRNPRFAISISSPLYWDVVYGLTAWDWNVYVDGLYAYAFPTFSNRLWWDWHWGSIGLGWGYGWPYYGYNWGWGWNSWYGWHSPWYYSSWGWGGWYSPYYSWGWYGGWGWHGGYYSWGRPYHGGWGYANYANYNFRRNDLGVGSAGRNMFGRSTRTTSTVARDNNGRTGGRVVSGGSGVNTRTSGASSRIARRATTSSGVGSGTTGTTINTRSATTRRSVGTSSSATTSRSSSTGVNRTYSTSSSRMNSRVGGSSSGVGSRSTTTTTRSYGNSSSRSYSSGGGFSGGSSGGGFSSGGGASTRSSGGGASSGGGGGARRR